MMKISGILGVVGVGVGLCATGCGSSGGGNSGPNVNFAQLRAEYTHPTGTLAPSDVLKVGSSFAQQQSTTSIPVAAARATIGRMQMENGGIQIENSYSSPCMGGGSLSISGASSGPSGSAGTINYNNCVVTSTASSATETVNGSITFSDSTNPPPTVATYSGSLTVMVTPPGTTTDVNMNYALVGGQETWSVSVASGTVLVTAGGSWNATTNTGTLTITDSLGTWTCTATNGTGSCTGPNGTWTFP